MTCLSYCQANGIWLDRRTYRAARWLERHGYRFMVDFGYQNAVEVKGLTLLARMR